MKNDPIFDAVLDVMAGERKPYAPNIVKYPDLEPKFDHEDDALMHDIMGNDNLAKPVQALLSSLDQYEHFLGSFGVDERRVIEKILPELKALREACVREFEKL